MTETDLAEIVRSRLNKCLCDHLRATARLIGDAKAMGAPDTQALERILDEERELVGRLTEALTLSRD